MAAILVDSNHNDPLSSDSVSRAGLPEKSSAAERTTTLVVRTAKVHAARQVDITETKNSPLRVCEASVFVWNAVFAHLGHLSFSMPLVVAADIPIMSQSIAMSI